MKKQSQSVSVHTVIFLFISRKCDSGSIEGSMSGGAALTKLLKVWRGGRARSTVCAHEGDWLVDVGRGKNVDFRRENLFHLLTRYWFLSRICAG
jgi:hypothetical protein